MLGAVVASQVLGPGGLIVFTGATAAFSAPNPDMIGYHLAKASTHELARNVAADQSMRERHVLTVLPMTIDTPANREAMPDADRSTWTPTHAIADRVVEWAMCPLGRPETGAFVRVTTDSGESRWDVVG